MADPRSLNALSILDLVASDAAYKSLEQYQQDFDANTPLYLQSWPDSSNGNEASFPNSLFSSLPTDGLTAHQTPSSRNGTHGGGAANVITFSNWKLIKKFQDDISGFGAAIFKSAVQESGKDQYIVAFQGSDGLDGRDWYQDLDLGQGVWRRNGPGVLTFLLEGGDGIDGERYVPSSGLIHFTGQSLGGGLAQYGAYFYARYLINQGETSVNRRLTLIDFNGFGAVAGIDALSNSSNPLSGLQKARYDPTVLARVPTIHYAIDNDIVHRLGAGNPNDLAAFGGSWHVNGVGNSYTFNFRRIKDGVERKLNPVDAHRIEAGFYRGFDEYQSTFATATNLEARNYDYVKTYHLQSIGALLSRLFSDGTADSLSSYARIAFGVLGATAVGPVSEIRELQKAIVDSAFDAGEITAAERAALRNGAVPIAIKALAIQSFATVSRVLGPVGWLFSIGIEIFSRLQSSEKAAIVQAQNRLLASDRPISYHAISDGEATAGDWLGRYDTYSVFAAQYADPADRSSVINTPERQRLADDLFGLDIDPDAFAGAVTSGTDWICVTANLIESTLVARGATPQQWAKTNADVIAYFAGQVDDVRQIDPSAAERMTAALRTFAREGIGSALASANADRLGASSLTSGSAFSGQVLDFAAYAAYRNALASLAGNETFASVRSYLESALLEVDRAGQRPLIKAFAAKPTNPFEDATFSPDVASALTGAVGEGGAGTYVLFLPYAAAPGGQRVRVDLGAAAPHDVKIISDGTSIVDTDGTFYLDVAQGRKEISFAVIVGDLDTNAELEFSATLVDAADTPTHRTHVVANLQLTSGDDLFQASFDASTSANLPSVDKISGRFEQNDPSISRTRLFGTGKGDLVIGDHASEAIATAAGNDFIIESNATAGGVFTAPDDIDTGAGNDFLTGYLGGHISLGEGNDFVNPNDLIRIDASLLTSSGSAQLAELPPEIYSDVAPFIRVRPDGDSPQFNPLVGGLDFSYFLDFGENNLAHPASGVSAKMGVVGSAGAARVERTSAGGASFGFITVDGTANISYSGGANPLTYGLSFVGAGDLHNTQAATIDGGAGDDFLFGAGGEDFIRGGPGDDRIAGYAGDDTLFGDDGADRILGGAGDDYIDAGSGDDRAWAEAGNDQLLGGSGSDELYGGEGADYLDGGTGNDFLVADSGNDEVFGGDGDDYLEGGDGRDYLDGEAGNDILSAGLGNDTLFGGEGADQLAGAEGDDYLDGEQGDDVLVGDGGNDTLFGGEGNDVLSGESGDDVLDGESGADQLAGGDGADAVYGGQGDDLLWGQAGNDYLEGGEGNDQLDGGDGADTLVGGGGTDVLLGGAGDDVYVFSPGDGVDLIDDAAGVNRVRFSADVLVDDVSAARTDPALGAQYAVLNYGISDAVLLRTQANVQAVEFADGTSITLADLLARGATSGYVQAPRLSIGSGANDYTAPLNADMLVFGLGGDDYLYGGSGDDTFYGGAGTDSIFSGAGNDTLVGGPGNDVLNAGAGVNTYVFARGDGEDSISNAFSGGEDTLELSGLSSADVSLSHLSNGDLRIAVQGTSDAVVVGAFYGASGSHLEHIVYADGTEQDMAQLRALARTPMSVDAQGHAAGTPDDDTLVGDGRDNVLDGGAGNDILIGGAGRDTYLLQIGMGRDTAIEAAGEPNILKLPLGVDFNQLVPSREGDDLVIAILGTNDGVALKDYYVGGRLWNVVTADGISQPLADVLKQLAELPAGDVVHAAQEKWLAASKNAVFRELGRSFGGGFIPVASDLYRRESNGSSIYLTAMVRASASNAAQIYNRYVDYAVDMPADIPATTTETVVIPLRGALSSDGPGNPVLDHGQLDAQGRARVVGMFNFDGSFFGELSGDYASHAPIGTLSSGAYVTQEIEHTNAVYGENIELISAGRANNLILPWGITAVDGSGGDDVINATGWLFSPWGSISGGDFLYGGGGNDRIFGTDDADVLIGGEGNDYLAGMAGHDTYYVVADQAGKKIIDESVVRHYLQPSYVGDGNGQAGFSSNDTVEFSPGIALGDLRLSWGQFDSTVVDDSGTGKRYPTLNMNWALGSGVKIVLPDLTNPDVVQRLAQYPGQSYGIEQFKFADGTLVSMDEMLTRATVEIGAPDPSRYAYEAGDGVQVLGDLEGLAEVSFGAGIDPTSFLIAGRAGDDLFLRLDASDSLRIKSWFSGQSVDLRFDDGTVWDASLLASLPSLTVGTDDRDTLYAPEGRESVVVGLRGDDSFFGSSGSDTYVFGRGDGADTIYDPMLASGAGLNTISFTADISSGDVGVTADDSGNLYLVVNDGGGRVMLSGWNAEDGSGKSFRARFEDGTEWSPAALDSRAARLPATAASDVVTGGNGDDVLLGLGGDDLLFGAAGNDVLDGGAGYDQVQGGTGNDILRGAGEDDVLGDSGGHNLIDGGAGDDTLSADSSSTNFWIGGPGADDLRGMASAGHNIVALNRGDGEDSLPGRLADDGVLTLSMGGDIALADLSLHHGEKFFFDLVVDAGAGDRLNLSAWYLNAPHADMRLQLISNGNIDVYDLTAAIASWESGGGAASTALEANRLSTSKDQALGGAIAYEYATAGNLNAMSSPVIRSFLSSDEFGVTAQPITFERDQSPVLASPIADQSAAEDSQFLFTLPPDTFSAPDGVVYSANLANGADLPGWLRFDPASLTFSGTPVQADVGAIEVRVTAKASASSADDVFAISIANVNDAPRVAGALGQRTGMQDQPFSFAVPLDAFADEDPGDRLSFTASPLPAWLTFDPATRSFSGIPRNADVGAVTVDVIATDAAGLSASSPLEIVIADVNDAPASADDLAAVAEDGALAAMGNVLANDRDIDAGTHLVVLEPGRFEGTYGALDVAANGAFTYTLNNAAAAVQSLYEGEITFDDFAYAASDGIASTPALLRVSIAGRNDAPVATADSALVVEDAELTASGNVLANDVDVDAQSHLALDNAGSYVDAATALGSLRLEADGSYQYLLDDRAAQSLGNGEIVHERFTYLVSDGYERATGTLDVAICGSNDAPVASALVPAFAATEDQPFSASLPADAFVDLDTKDRLAYTVSRSDGASLPDWLSFDPASFALRGTPTNADVGLLSLRVVATDTVGAFASQSFTLSVANVNDAPVVANGIPDQFIEAGTALSFAVPQSTFSDVDAGDRLTYSAGAMGGGPLPSWLKFNSATGSFTGTPPAIDIGVSGIQVRATDGSGASAATEFALIVTAKAGSSVSGGAGADVIYGGSGNETLSGGGGGDALFGLAGNDILSGGKGNDVLQGGSGTDVLRGGKGNNVLDGGSGSDALFDGAGSAFIAGGLGNDTIRVGSGRDILAYNRGDGSDTVIGGGDGGNTLSLGGGIRYSDLSLAKSGRDLILNAGGEDRLVFRDWYSGNHSLLTLQMIEDASADFDAASTDALRNRRVETFNFLGLVSAFDRARAESPGVTSWAVTNALMQAHLAASDDAALGGDLAYWYGKNGSLAGMSLQAAQQVIGAAGFGADAQQLHPFSGLQDGLVKLG